MKARNAPIGIIPSLAASAEQIVGDITLYRMQTFAVAVRATYDAAATAGVRLKFYFSPDGKNYDTVAYAYFDIDLTAGSTVQETKLVDAPEKGNLRVAIENIDAVKAATVVTAWVSIVKE